MASKYPGSAPSDRDFPPTSDFDASELSEDILTSDSAPGPSSGISSDSEDDEPQEEEGFSFSYEGNRTTFFRTSAERGQWKSNPMPLKQTLLQTRKSAPTHSRVATPTLINPLRMISEPAPQQDVPDHALLENTSRDAPISIPATASMVDEVESPHTLPSLSSDRESSLDVDIDTPSSPLPPSSPPLSPMSFSVSIISRSVSPLLFERDSSPLSEVPDDEDAIMDVPELLGAPALDDVSFQCLLQVIILIPLVLKPLKTETQLIAMSPCTTVQSVDEDSHPSAVTAPLLDERETSGPPSFPPSNPQDDDASSVLIASSAPSTPPPPSIVAERVITVDNGVSSKLTTRVQPVIVRKKSGTLRDKNGVDRFATAVASSSTTTVPDAKVKPVKEKRKKDTERAKEKKQGSLEPVKKKRKVDEDEQEGDVMPSRGQKSKKTEVENVDSNSTHAGPKKKRNSKKGDGDVHASTAKRTDNNRRLPKTKRSSSTIYSSEDEEDANSSKTSDPPLDPETAALHAQICGLLIETMAMSRASSLPVSSLFKLVMQDQPSLKTQRSEREWVEIFDRVLHAGELGRGSGVFGKVESSGKVCFFFLLFFFVIAPFAFPFIFSFVRCGMC